MASQNTGLSIVYSTVYSGADQRKHQSSASLAFVSGIHQSPVNSAHKGPVTRKMFPFDDVIMRRLGQWWWWQVLKYRVIYHNSVISCWLLRYCLSPASVSFDWWHTYSTRYVPVGNRKPVGYLSTGQSGQALCLCFSLNRGVCVMLDWGNLLFCFLKS